jgi:aminoglycoside phosphotransferase (APT) family kinase protein
VFGGVDERAVLHHPDFEAGNILIDDEGRVAGVVD